MLLALGMTFLIPSEYQSTAQLMPPEQGALSGQSLLIDSMLGPAAAEALLSSRAEEGFLSGRSTAGTAMGILNSRTVLDAIINRFDLRSVYHRKFYKDARKELINQTKFSEDRKSGIVAITVTDSNPNRARDIVQAYIDELTKLVDSLSASSARRQREFLDARLKTIKQELDSNAKALSEFSSRNATMDPAKQGEATLEAVERLQGEVIAAQSNLSSLTAIYANDNVRVQAARRQVDELQKQLAKLAGGQTSAGGSNAGVSQGIPSMRELPLIGVTYEELYLKVQMEEQLYEALSKEDEAAKVEEAEQIVPVKVLDPPQVPERRESKHRAIYMLVGMLLSLVISSAWIIIREFWRTTEDSHPAKALLLAILHSHRRSRVMSSH
jgi:capsule polysaccharide export protein KpsE/RkpR